MKKETIFKFFIIHSIVVVIILFIVFIYKCPINYFFRVQCPGCGITRAYLSAFKLDFISAFRYHPLFFTIAPTILYIAHRSLLRIKLSCKIEKLLFGILSVLFIFLYIVRIITDGINILK